MKAGGLPGHRLTLAEPLPLDCGIALPEVVIAYQTYVGPLPR